ncbi:MAG: hypothetical protein ABIK08_04565 [Pseudomonadota bacterium]
MKAALKKLTQPAASPFERLVTEALAIYRELADASNQFHDARDEKLSAEGYLAEALKNARTTLKKIEALDKTVSQLPPDDASNNDMLRFIGNVYASAVATRYDKGVALRPVVGNLHRMVDGDSAAYVNVIVASNMLGANPFECVALAALRATRDHPESFGRIDDWDKHHAALAEKRARLDALYQQVAENWRDADKEISDVSADGRVLLTIKVGSAEVPLGDPATLGERLCAALAA